MCYNAKYQFKRDDFMQKTYVKAMVINRQQNIKLNGFGSYDEDNQVLSWMDQAKTNYQLNLLTKKFEKDDKASILNYTFDINKETEGTILLKENNGVIKLTVLTTNFKILDHNCLITYHILEDDNKESEIKFTVTWK